MSEYQAIARPYAQAVFELAKDAGDYQSWSSVLAYAGAVAADPQIRELAHNPRVDDETIIQVFEDICGDRLFPQAKNFLRLIVGSDRIFALPDVVIQFEKMRAEAEGTIEAELISALAVSDDQKAKIAKFLSKRLGRKVTLRVNEDPTLIGGAILRAGDMVIDASVKGRLAEFAANLAR